MRFLQLEPAEYGMYWKIDPMLMQHAVDPSAPVNQMVEQMAHSMMHCLTTIRCVPTEPIKVIHHKPGPGAASDPYLMETFGCKVKAKWRMSHNLRLEGQMLNALFKVKLGLKAKGFFLDSPLSKSHEDDDE